MDDSEHMPANEDDAALEAKALEIVTKVIPTLRVARNVTKVLRRLSSAGTETLVAIFEAKTSRERLEKARNEHLISELAKLPGEQSNIRAKVGERLLIEQHRIDQIVFEAIEHIKASDHSAPSGEAKSEEEGSDIDDDWIESFRREAIARSQGEMRETFVRILAGEIAEPGTFSIKAIHTVGGLSQSTASLFQRAASLRVGMEIVVSLDSGSRLYVLDARLPSLGGALAENHFMDEGLDYERLTELTENGLLNPNYNSWQNYDPAIPLMQIVDPKQGVVSFIHQDQRWVLRPLPSFKAGSNLKISGAKFTTVGRELLHIVDIGRDAAFLGKVRTYLQGLHVDMVALE